MGDISFQNVEPTLIWNQIGLIIYCTLMTVTFKRDGGVHEWDLTLPESYGAIYVRSNDL